MVETQAEKEMRWKREKELRWKREDENSRYGASRGNPYATLCSNCYGRHWSPKDAECPHSKFEKQQPQ